jgi:hypothetical protein
MEQESPVFLCKSIASVLWIVEAFEAKRRFFNMKGFSIRSQRV